MKTNLPTTPGPYWWRANDECDWDPVYVREDSTVPGYEYTVLFPETGVEIDLPDLRGQWAKAHKPDEGIDAWAVFAPNGNPMIIAMTEQEVINETGSPQPKAWEALQCHGFTCEPVTICRKEKE